MTRAKSWVRGQKMFRRRSQSKESDADKDPHPIFPELSQNHAALGAPTLSYAVRGDGHNPVWWWRWWWWWFVIVMERWPWFVRSRPVWWWRWQWGWGWRDGPWLGYRGTDDAVITTAGWDTGSIDGTAWRRGRVIWRRETCSWRIFSIDHPSWLDWISLMKRGGRSFVASNRAIVLSFNSLGRHAFDY